MIELNDIRERLVRIEEKLDHMRDRVDDHGDRLRHIENTRLAEVERKVWIGTGIGTVVALSAVAVWESIKTMFHK